MNLFKRRRALNNRRATATVEFAVIAPVFLTLILGMLEASRLFDTYSQLAQAARDGARLGAMDRADWVSSGLRSNDKIIADIRSSLEAAGYNPDKLEISIEPANKPGESFDLDDPNNDLDLFQVRIALPFSEVAAMPVPDGVDYDLSTAVIFRNTRSTIVQ
ncbi:TadE family protein [Bremerella cremea]|uniref:TadE family protein n=1 Tax=Bremerella cremea TaxID=1031537 RepID=UPI0031E8C49B